MKRMIPGLVICSALVAVGAGAAVFSGAGRDLGVWDAVLVISTLAFLAFFVMVLAGKAATTLSQDDSNSSPGIVPDPADPGMKPDSRSTQPDAMLRAQTSQSEQHRSGRSEPTPPRKDRADENVRQPTAPRPNRIPPR